jgi:hypothetical protein
VVKSLAVEIEQVMQRGPASFQFAAFDSGELVLCLAACGLT